MVGKFTLISKKSFEIQATSEVNTKIVILDLYCSVHINALTRPCVFSPKYLHGQADLAVLAMQPVYENLLFTTTTQCYRLSLH